MNGQGLVTLPLWYAQWINELPYLLLQGQG